VNASKTCIEIMTWAVRLAERATCQLLLDNKDRRTKMHLFPTALAILECSSINSESQSRPLAVADTISKHS
jgi:hypothetical protein